MKDVLGTLHQPKSEGFVSSLLVGNDKVAL